MNKTFMEMEEVQKSFGETLKNFRKRRGLTQQEVAARLKIHRNTIGSWERGDFLPESKELILELAKQLELDVQCTQQLLETSYTTFTPYWNVPYPRNPLFTGRNEILCLLYTLLQPSREEVTSQIYGLYGLAGIGKTQLAVEYAYRHRLLYQAVFWISAHSQTSIIASLQQIAEHLGLPGRQEGSEQEMVNSVQKWLSQRSQWLLIWDHVEQLELLLNFLPLAYRGMVLMTTCRQALGGRIQGIPLGPMTAEEGLQLLLKRAKVSDLSGASSDGSELVEQVGALPLALDQLGAFAEETGWSMTQCLHYYQTQRKQLLARRSILQRDYPDSVFTTLYATIEQVRATNTLASELLVLCALLSPEGVKEDHLLIAATSLSQVDRADTYQFDRAITILRNFSLITRNHQQQKLSVHCLVQAVIEDQMDREQLEIWGERLIQAIYAMLPSATDSMWQCCEDVLSYASVCHRLLKQQGMMFLQAAQLFDKVGRYLLEQGRYKEAGEFLEASSAQWERLVEPTDLRRVECFYWQAVLLRYQGYYERAKLLQHRVLELRKQQLGLDHLQTAESLNELAVLYCCEGNAEQAELLCQRALAIREQHLGPDHPQTAQSLSNLAFHYWKQGKYEQAEAIGLHALTLFEQSLGANHLDTARCLSNLARLYWDLEKNEKAKLFAQRALAIREQHLGPDHPEIAASLEDTACLYQQQNCFEQAEIVLLRSLTICERQLGTEHPQTTSVLFTLAHLYLKQDQNEQAKILFERVMTSNTRYLGPGHLQTAMSMGALALLYQKLREYRLAESLYQQALMIFEKRASNAHPRARQLRKQYMSLLFEMSQITNDGIDQR